MSVIHSKSRTAGFNTSTKRFCNHLRDNASRFFPEFSESDVEVKLLHHAKRHHSQLLKLQVSNGRIQRQVIYKIPFCLQSAELAVEPSEERPRLFSVIDPLTNGLREYRALESVEQHFRELNDPRFGVIDMFELLEQPFVEVMQCCPDKDLKSLLKRATRLHGGDRRRVDKAFRHSGAWLREFHTLPDLEFTEQRHEYRDDFIDAAQRFTKGLIQHRGRRDFFNGICSQLIKAAQQLLPREVPSAVVHGDFAPRNILVGADSRVTVFDMQRRCRAPLFEDIAYFLMSVKTPGPQVRYQGAFFSHGQLAHWESQFLSGYFGEQDMQHGPVRLYEILLTLEWWAAINFRQTGGRVLSRMSLALSNRYLFRYVAQLLNDLP